MFFFLIAISKWFSYTYVGNTKNKHSFCGSETLSRVDINGASKFCGFDEEYVQKYLRSFHIGKFLFSLIMQFSHHLYQSMFIFILRFAYNLVLCCWLCGSQYTSVASLAFGSSSLVSLLFSAMKSGLQVVLAYFQTFCTSLQEPSISPRIHETFQIKVLTAKNRKLVVLGANSDQVLDSILR